MSAAEIRATIDQMGDEERFVAAAYLHHLTQAENTEYRSRLAARLDCMDTGQKVTQEQLLRAHGALEEAGL